MARFLDYLSCLSSFLPVIAGLLTFGKIRRGLLSFFIFFCFVLFADVLTFITGLLNINNMPIGNIYFLIDALFLFYIFYHLALSKSLKKIILFMGVIYPIVWFLDNCFYHDLHLFNPTEKVFKFTIFIFICAWLMNNIAGEINIPLPENYKFWLILGFLVYFSSSLIVIATSTWVFNSQNEMAMLYTWSVHSIITVFVNCIFTFGFICFSRKKNLFY